MASGRKPSFGHQPRKRFGQNFLHDQSVIAEIVGTLHPPPGALVVDLGAGSGALTRAAAQDGRRVLAVELDPRYVQHLRSRAASWGDVHVVADDALTVPFPQIEDATGHRDGPDKWVQCERLDRECSRPRQGGFDRRPVRRLLARDQPLGGQVQRRDG